MRIIETCSCGAKIDVTDTDSVATIAVKWRAEHKHIEGLKAEEPWIPETFRKLFESKGGS